MGLDERFDDLTASIGGFYRSWAAYLGLELGLFAALRTAGGDGLTAEELAAKTGCRPEPVDAWLRSAFASDLVEFDGDCGRISDDIASIMLDDARPEFLGGQFVSSVVSTLDYEGMAEYFRTGRTIAERPPRFHRAIEQVTGQDIAVCGGASLPR
jgi:hypothetical protein